MTPDPSSRPLEVSVAVHEERLDTIEEELLRHRMRIHELEGDRSTLRLLMEQMKQLTANAEKIARQAARDAIDLAMEHRDDLGHRRWGLRLQWAAFGIAAGGFVSSIAFQVFH